MAVPGLTLLAVGNGDEEVIVHNQRQSPIAVTSISCVSLFVACGDWWLCKTNLGGS
jgi:hypothetical protein